MDQEQSPGFSDYLAALRRRRNLIFGIGAPLAIAGLVVALALPSSYRSQGLFEIEEGKLASYLPNAAGDSRSVNQLDQYVASLSEKVLVNDRLSQLALDVQPYPELRRRTRRGRRGIARRRRSEDGQAQDPRPGDQPRPRGHFRLHDRLRAPRSPDCAAYRAVADERLRRRQPRAVPPARRRAPRASSPPRPSASPGESARWRRSSPSSSRAMRVGCPTSPTSTWI